MQYEIQFENQWTLERWITQPKLVQISLLIDFHTEIETKQH